MKVGGNEFHESIHNFMGLRKCMRSHIQQRNLMTFTSCITVVFLSLRKACSALLSTATLLQSPLWTEFSTHILTLHWFASISDASSFFSLRSLPRIDCETQSHYKGDAFSLTFSFSPMESHLNRNSTSSWRNRVLRVGFWAQVRKWVEAQKAETNQVEGSPGDPGGPGWM